MPRLGRNREKNKRMPIGWTPIGKVVYFVPTNAADLDIVRRATGAITVNGKLEGGKKSLRLGPLDDHNACAKTYAERIVTAREARDEFEPGTIGELVFLARRDILPTLTSEITAKEWQRYWKELETRFGRKPYARTIHEAAYEPFKYFSAVDVQNYVDAAAETRPVAANRAVDAWSEAFVWARNRWGRTEYNPCAGIEKNPEDPRDVLPDHVELYKGVRAEDGQAMPRGIYRQLLPPARFILNMYRYYGRRRGETLRLTLSDVKHADGIHMLRGKERQRRATKRKAPRRPRVLIIPWDTRNKRMVARLLRWREDRIRMLRDRSGEGKPPAETIMLLVNRDGGPYTKEAAKSAWRRGMARSEQKGNFTQHDVRALRATTLPLDVAQGVLAHEDRRTTETTYRNRGPHIVDLKGHK